MPIIKNIVNKDSSGEKLKLQLGRENKDKIIKISTPIEIRYFMLHVIVSRMM